MASTTFVDGEGSINADWLNDVNDFVYEGLNIKILDIGDWNMDTTFNLDVAHGIVSGLSKIRTVQVSIIDDLGTSIHDFNTVNGSETSTHTITWDGTNISLIRGNNGFFDATTFNLTPHERGWITVGYIN